MPADLSNLPLSPETAALVARAEAVMAASREAVRRTQAVLEQGRQLDRGARELLGVNPRRAGEGPPAAPAGQDGETS